MRLSSYQIRTVMWGAGDGPVGSVLVMEASSAQAPSSEASSDALKLSSSSAVTATPTPSKDQKSLDISARPIATPNLDSREAFLEFCRLYAPYMQYSILLNREVRLKAKCC